MRARKAVCLSMCCMWAVLNPIGPSAGAREVVVADAGHTPEHRTQPPPDVGPTFAAGRARSERAQAWMSLPARKPAFAPALVTAALRFLGRPFQWAGIGHRGFDCSGLVQRVFAAIGVDLPHSSFDQFRAGIPVPVSALSPGDLVFFHTYVAGPSHVGIYLGARRFVHASPSRGVIISSMEELYFRSRYLGARRF